MAKEINISKEIQIGDIKTVHLLTHKRKMNKGKGYSFSLVSAVKNGDRKNDKVAQLFLEVIENRNQLLK